jgi:hypothetical protein
MEKTFVSLIVLLSSLALYSQSYPLTHGKETEVKIEKGDFEIISIDSAFVYYTEDRIKPNAFAINRGYDRLVSLYKVDHNFSEIFHKSYKKELKGLNFSSIRRIGDDLYLLATDYRKGNKSFSFYGAKIDKNTGDLVKELTELGTFKIKEESRGYKFIMTASNNGTGFRLIAEISTYEKKFIGISIIDQNLQVKQSVTIQPPSPEFSYQLKDICLTPDDKLVFLARTYEEMNISKKVTDMRFKNYVLSVYNMNGQKERDIPLQSGDDHLINAEVIERGDELLLAAFYGSTTQKGMLSGFLISKINILEGSVIPISRKEINPDNFSKSFVDYSDEFDDNIRESKLKSLAQQIRAKGILIEYPDETIFRSVIVHPHDSSITIVAEVSGYSYRKYTHKVRPAVQSTWETYHLYSYKQKDALVIKADNRGNIQWLTTIPKSQEEEEFDDFTYYPYYRQFDRNGIFFPRPMIPDYSSFISYANNTSLILLLNDHTNNATSSKVGELVKTVINFRNTSSLHAVKVDLSTGKMTREVVAANTPETLMRLKDAFIANDGLFIPLINSSDEKTTKVKITKVSIK